MTSVDFSVEYRLTSDEYTRTRPHVKISRYRFADRNYLLLDDEIRFGAYARLPDAPEAELERREALSRRFLVTVTRGDPHFEGPAIDLTVPINDLKSKETDTRFDLRNATDPISVEVVVTAVQNPVGDPLFHDEKGEPEPDIGYTEWGIEWPDITPFDADWTPNSGEAYGVRQLGRIEVDPAKLD